MAILLKFNDYVPSEKLNLTKDLKRENTIVITFQQIGYMGRLGNQMFQFAATLGIAKKLGLDARFPLENCLRLQGSGPFDPNIGRNMLVKCDILDCFEIGPEYFIPERHLVFDKSYHETVFEYDSKVESIQDNTALYGYFQTEKYFLNAKEEIYKQFTFKSHIKQLADSYMENIRSAYKDSHIVSIHVRRGDYVMFPDHHPTCSKEYYDSSISKFEDLTKKKFLVFSDDPEWCRTEFAGDNFIICDIGDPYVELCCMSLCDHHIIANSSFSWWGAWLNENSDCKVIAPSRWFGPSISKNAKDVYCKDWEVI